MAEAAAPSTEEAEGEPKKKKPILLIAVIALSVILLIVSVVFGTLFMSGYFAHKSEAAAHEKVDELDKAAEEAHAMPEGPSKVKKEAEATRFENTYLQIDKEFMTNITNSKKVMVVQIAVMTHYDARVFDNVKKHEFAIRDLGCDAPVHRSRHSQGQLSHRIGGQDQGRDERNADEVRRLRWH